jgi:hypothetical protein
MSNSETNVCIVSVPMNTVTASQSIVVHIVGS